jgi:hypothetical protein
VHGARKRDVDGEADRFWVIFDGDRITAAGHGTGWALHRAHATTRSVLSLVADPVVALEHGFSRTPSTPCPGSGTALTWILARALGLDDRLGRLRAGLRGRCGPAERGAGGHAVWGAGRRLA